MRLSIIIPAYNESALIESSLEEIILYVRRADITAEIIVSDDGSTDDTVPLVARMAQKYKKSS
jgi:glycosyltransferase involved in cell wall biosynthesis